MSINQKQESTETINKIALLLQQQHNEVREMLIKHKRETLTFVIDELNKENKDVSK